MMMNRMTVAMVALLTFAACAAPAEEPVEASFQSLDESDRLAVGSRGCSFPDGRNKCVSSAQCVRVNGGAADEYTICRERSRVAIGSRGCTFGGGAPECESGGRCVLVNGGSAEAYTICREPLVPVGGRGCSYGGGPVECVSDASCVLVNAQSADEHTACRHRCDIVFGHYGTCGIEGDTGCSSDKSGHYVCRNGCWDWGTNALARCQ